MPFDGEFDAAFSNATLHWVLAQGAGGAGDLPRAEARRPLRRRDGRGGQPRQTLREALDEELIIRGYVPPIEASNWYASPEEFAAVYEAAGFEQIDARLIERPTPIEHGIAAWVTTFRRAGSTAPGARGRARRDRRRGRRPRRLQRRRLRPPSLHHEEARH